MIHLTLMTILLMSYLQWLEKARIVGLVCY